MRGLNHWNGAGNVTNTITFAKTGKGADVCTFTMACDRYMADGTVTVWVKVNVYMGALVQRCRERLARGTYVVIEGELMNRDGRIGELLEVRAREIIFPPGPVRDGAEGEVPNGS